MNLRDVDDYDLRDKESWYRYLDEVENSENFEVGDYPYPGSTVYGAYRPAMTGWLFAFITSGRVHTLAMSKSSWQRNEPSENDPEAKIVQDRLFQVIKTYTIDSQLDTPYSLALYLSQYALVIHVLQEDVAKHDMESLKVLKLVKSVAKVPTYLITFEAPLCAETGRKNVETFETEICMPTLFPTTMIELISEVRVITA
ncbi:hypothetical protein POM88_025219 [Heracleum sosnowskyi]|uniref:Uncharacterized protein n=1 Tax=Heracleum sosnowskyi TaxID=360622 RepID=A0AAD8I6L6_9APIA|nr:hypothetical protein POM88_025219 [Heracleum sosnowskyi]